MPDRRLRIPGRLFGGRIRTSTVALIAAFIGLVWLDQVYEPPPPEPVQQWVPPGFVPNPDYTWVPRTAVRRPPTTESEPTTTTTTTTTPPADTPTTTPPAVTTPEEPTTTVIDPDGPGLLPPTTVTETDRPDLGAPPTPWGPPTTTTAPAFGPGQQPQNQPPGAARPPGG